MQSIKKLKQPLLTKLMLASLVGSQDVIISYGILAEATTPCGGVLLKQVVISLGINLRQKMKNVAIFRYNICKIKLNTYIKPTECVDRFCRTS